MSVILKGPEIQIPNSCDVCSFCGCDFTCMNYTADCFGEDISDYEMCRHSKCNLVEIPEGARLIDGNKISSDMDDMKVEGETFVTAVNFVKLIVNDAPVIFEED